MDSPTHLPPAQLDPPPPPEDPSPYLLLAPPGWQKKIASLKKGVTRKKKDIYFVAPDGEEIKSKRLLDRYLKSHPGGPTSSEFDWSTGDTPTRRSSRLSAKASPSLDSPEDGSSRKRHKKIAEERSLDEEKESDKQLDTAPPISDEKEELLEEAENVEESKTEEDMVAQTLEEKENDDKEPELQYTQTESAPGTTMEVEESDIHAQEDNEPEGQVPAEEKLVKEQCEGTKVDKKVCEDQARKDQLDAQDGEAHITEEQRNQKEVSGKMSTGFQQIPEAQNSSVPVDVSI